MGKHGPNRNRREQRAARALMAARGIKYMQALALVREDAAAHDRQSASARRDSEQSRRPVRRVRTTETSAELSWRELQESIMADLAAEIARENAKARRRRTT